MKTTPFPLCSLVFASSLAASEIRPAPEIEPAPDLATTKINLGDYIDAFSSEASYSAPAEFDESGGEFDFTDLSALSFLTKPIDLGGDWSFISYLTVSASRLNFSDNPMLGGVIDDLETDLFRISLPFVVAHSEKGSRWAYGAWVNPAIATDFDHIDGDDFFLDAAIAAVYRVNPCFSIGAGVFASDILEDPFVIPGVGFVWVPQDDWLITYFGPRFVVRHDLNDRNQLGFEVSTNGGNWNLDADGESLKLNLRSWRTGLYYRHNLAGEVWLIAGAGVTIANQVELRTRRGNNLFRDELGEASSAPYAYLGLNVARW